MKDCRHPNVGVHVEPSAFEDTNVVVLRIAVACDRCGKRFRFLGIEERDQVPALLHPRVQREGSIASLPMVLENEIPRLAAN